MQQYSNRPPFMGPEYHYDLRALIFGIVSFLFCQLPVLSVVTGIVALVCSKGEKAAVELQPRHASLRYHFGNRRHCRMCTFQHLLGHFDPADSDHAL